MTTPADPDIDPEIDFLAELPEQVVYLLYQVHRRRETSLEADLEAAGLPLAVWRLLLALQRMQPCTMNALARYTTAERTALTRHIDQMVKEGLAVRSTPPDDRRKVLVSLTDAGIEGFEKGRSIVTRWNRKALEGIPPERLQILREGLRALIRNMVPDQALAEEVITFNHRAGARA